MYEQLLSSDQGKAALEGERSGDPLVDEAALRLKTLKTPSVGTPTGTTSLTWRQARTLILPGLVRSTFEFGDGSVVLVALSGADYRTKPPSKAALNATLDSVDPCFLFIRRSLVVAANNASSGREK
jgi:hypothetical protein